MTRIFVAYATADASCAKEICKDLQAKGYSTWQPPASLQLTDLLYPRTIQTTILGCAAFILLWSSDAAQSEEVEQQLLFAQRLRKPSIVVKLDSTSLPNTLIPTTTVEAYSSCSDVVALLLQQPLLPAPESADPLILLSERATHELVRERKAAIEQAADMLVQNQHREAVLALLEYLAHNDLMNGVREKAQEALDADARQQVQHVPPPLVNPADSRHMFGVRCKNGHISYFDKRLVCKLPKSHVHRVVQRTQTELDELDLECKTCHIPVSVRIDCEGYR